MRPMGWCQEFGVQIRGGCGHLMVANADSCSCAECGVVCRGKFPSCADVWAAGPVDVPLTRPRPGPRGAQIVSGSKSANGKAASVLPIMTPTTPTTPTTASTPPESDLFALVHSLRSEIATLNGRLEHVEGRAGRSDEAAGAAAHSTAELSAQIRKPIQAAMQRQHLALLESLIVLREQVRLDVGRIVGELRAPPNVGAEAATAAQLDTRFEWLVNELSDKLVVVGNEVARINQMLSARAADRLATAATEGMTEPSPPGDTARPPDGT